MILVETAASSGPSQRGAHGGCRRPRRWSVSAAQFVHRTVGTGGRRRVVAGHESGR